MHIKAADNDNGLCCCMIFERYEAIPDSKHFELQVSNEKRQIPPRNLHIIQPFQAQSACQSITNRLILKKIFRGTLRRAADHRLQTCALLPCNQPQRATRRTREDCPVRILRLTQLPRLLQEKQRARLHLFRDPYFQKVQLLYHACLFIPTVVFARDPRSCADTAYRLRKRPPQWFVLHVRMHYFWCKGYRIFRPCQSCICKKK
jgi:hypothetical protein